MLFDIAMEALSRMLDVVATAGQLSRMLDVAATARQFLGFSVGSTASTSLMVSHLLFADDTLIFCDATPTQIANLRRFSLDLGRHQG